MKYKVTEAYNLDSQVIGITLNEAGSEERTRREQFTDHAEYIDVFDDLATAEMYFGMIQSK